MDTTKRTTKFFMTINDSVYQKIKRLASKRGITTQEFIRAIIIPEWLDIERNKKTHFKTKNSS
jgi:predicted DNA binding CopG/RHH family protein